MQKFEENERITAKHVQVLIPNVGKSAAYNMINLCRCATGREKPKVLTVGQFRDYYDV